MKNKCSCGIAFFEEYGNFLDRERNIMTERQLEYTNNPKRDLPGGVLNSPVCSKCHHFITDDERNTIEGEQVCSNCYYGALGEEVERYPIGGHQVPQGSS